MNKSNFYSASIRGVARLGGATAESVFDSKLDKAVPYHQRTIGRAGVYGGKGQVEEIRFLKFTEDYG